MWLEHISGNGSLMTVAGGWAIGGLAIFQGTLDSARVVHVLLKYKY